MSAESGSSDADRPGESSPAAAASLTTAHSVSTAPLDAGAPAAINPAGQLTTAAATGSETTASTEATGRDVGRAGSAIVKSQRKTCILKLDGCHYTIGT